MHGRLNALRYIPYNLMSYTESVSYVWETICCRCYCGYSGLPLCMNVFPSVVLRVSTVLLTLGACAARVTVLGLCALVCLSAMFFFTFS